MPTEPAQKKDLISTSGMFIKLSGLSSWVGLLSSDEITITFCLQLQYVIFFCF